jgi:hypothetical protein
VASTPKMFSTYVFEFPSRHEKHETNPRFQFHKGEVVEKYDLRDSKERIKTVTDSGDLLALLSFNFAYDQRILPTERQRLDIAACYLILGYTGCRPAEIVDITKKKPAESASEPCHGNLIPTSLKTMLGLRAFVPPFQLVAEAQETTSICE